MNPDKLNKSKGRTDAEKVLGLQNPVEITDQEAYDEYQRLNKNPILTTKKDITTSDGRRISLGTLDWRLKEMIKHLPPVEQNQILAQRKLYNNLLCKRNAAQRKAFGTIVTGENKPTIRSSVFDQRKQEMIELFGRMFSTTEVHEICVKDWALPVTHKAVGEFRTVHWETISKKIEEHKRTFSDIRLGHKRSRLEELVWLYNTRKRIYEVTRKGEDHKTLLVTLEQIRKEVEGDSLRLDGALQFNMEQSIQAHIDRELFKHLPLKEIILSRVAAKLNTSAEVFVTQLNRAYYGKVITEDITHEDVTLPDYPSTQPYDFERIKRQHAAGEHNVVVASTGSTQVVGNGSANAALPAPNAAAVSVKEALLAKLKKQQAHVNFTKTNLQGKFLDKQGL